MKRITSKVLNILIIFILLIAYIFPIMSFANSNFTTYVALGDDTVADKIIPFAGENAALIILFVVLFTVAVTTFIWLKKNKDFK